MSRWVVPLGILGLMPVLMGIGGCPCGDDADCAVGDFCDEGGCVDCRDNADCSPEFPVCVDTFCEECGGAADCDDGDVCTTDTCDENNECVREANNECVRGDGTCPGIVCDDGNACTVDSCAGGVCQNLPVDCDDDDPCTVDFCDEATGCGHQAVICSFGRSCDPDTGECVFGCNVVDCDDGDACTTNACVDGECIFTDVDCDDGDLCTVDSCDQGTGECISTAVQCPLGDTCDPKTGECVGGSNCPVTGACRELPDCYDAGASSSVTIQVTPPTDTLAYGVEDSPPAGWTVSGISDDGAYDAGNNAVKWVFLDGEPRTLTYMVNPPGNASGNRCFSGQANFDGGASQDIGGSVCVGKCSGG